MSCIVCGFDGGVLYNCAIKELSVCFCEEHLESQEEYDSVELRGVSQRLFVDVIW